jgi:hypothetical protein
MLIGDPLPPPIAMSESSVVAVYHVAIKGVPIGPFDLPTVKSMIRTGEITVSTQIWHKGLPEWIRAENVPELSASFQTTPPPLPPG